MPATPPCATSLSLNHERARHRLVARDRPHHAAAAAIAALAPGMVARGSGRIVTVASMASLMGYAYVAAYTAAKHAVLGLTRSFALELARTGVTVNAVCPGYTDTDLVTGSLDRLQQKTGRDRDAPAVSGITGQALAIADGET